MTSTGVSYVRPLVLPVCRMTDVWVPAEPAVRITLGFVSVRFIRRTASSTGGSFHRMPATSSRQQYHRDPDDCPGYQPGRPDA